MKAIILAAGQSKRMKSKLRKTLHPLCGKPVVTYIRDACKEAGITDITVVISQDDGAVKTVLPDVRFAVQENPRGTGHAVQAAFATGGFADDDDILVLCGDMPLLSTSFIQALTEYYRKSKAACVVTTPSLPENRDFGHVYADEADNFIENVEVRDLKPHHGKTDLRQAGCYLFNGAALAYGLSKMTDDNAQKEYYLTDVPKHIRESGKNVKVFRCDENPVIFTGINTQAQLANAAVYMRQRINAKHMENGVRMIDPATTYIDEGVEIGADAVIYPGVVLEGKCVIASDAKILAHSVLIDAKVGANSQIGPFAYLRPGTTIGANCRIGNFVEVKNATIGNKTNAAHHAYIGDADVGSGVNYSCGAITANYDGKNKSRTVIKDNAFIGSNAALIAPIEVGEWGYVAAGSTLNKDVPAETLAIARARQENKENWKKDPRRQ